jgi:hypothetical protein
MKDDEITLYQSYVGILQWAIELGCIDVAHAGSTMVKFMAAPCQGHLVALVRTFAYLKQHLRSNIVFDPTYKDWSHKNWIQGDWVELYPEAAELIPGNAPEAQGEPVQLNMYCHAMDLIARRSTTGILIFANSSPILWYSKRKKMIESSVFGSELVALKIATEMKKGLRYKHT